MTRQVEVGSGYASQSDTAVHFGLGLAEQIEAVEVAWPDGSRERFAGGPADRVVVLRQGEGTRRP